MCVQTLVEEECESYAITLRSSDDISVKSVVSFFACYLAYLMSLNYLTYCSIHCTTSRRGGVVNQRIKTNCWNTRWEIPHRKTKKGPFYKWGIYRIHVVTRVLFDFTSFSFFVESLCLTPQVTVLNLQLDFKSSVTQQGEWITSDMMRYPSHYISKPDRSIIAPLEVASPNVAVQAYRRVTAQHI